MRQRSEAPTFLRFAAMAGGVVLAGAGVAFPAHAEVLEASARGFVIRHYAEVPQDAQKTFATLADPALWWSSAHTYSGDARNLSIDPRPGGCFCEVLPGKGAGTGGGVEHMRVIYADRPRVLRMSGALGPLQADAAQGTLTLALDQSGKGTRIKVEYVVGGFVQADPVALAPLVDKVLGEQVQSLARKLDGEATAAPASAAGRDAEGAARAKNAGE